jgi:nitrogenase-stabilizing/protective protein
VNLPDFRELEEAEDFFAFLDVPYDARVLDRSRLVILKRFSFELDEAARAVSDATAEGWRALAREALRRAYAPFERAPGGGDATLGAIRLVKLRTRERPIH